MTAEPLGARIVAPVSLSLYPDVTLFTRVRWLWCWKELDNYPLVLVDDRLQHRYYKKLGTLA